MGANKLGNGRSAGSPVLEEKRIEQKKEKDISLADIFKPGGMDETPDKARAEIVKELMGAKNLNRVTEVSNFDIAMLSAAKGVNSKAGSSVLNEFVKQFLELRVSNGRKGRSEVVDITKSNETQPFDLKPKWRSFI